MVPRDLEFYQVKENCSKRIIGNGDREKQDDPTDKTTDNLTTTLGRSMMKMMMISVHLNFGQPNEVKIVTSEKKKEKVTPQPVPFSGK